MKNSVFKYTTWDILLNYLEKKNLKLKKWSHLELDKRTSYLFSFSANE